jgi:hypothetical protein
MQREPGSERPGALAVEHVRRLVADATHRAVAEHTGTDGFGHCMGYAMVGMCVASRAFGRDFFPQAGSLYLHPDPEDEGLVVSLEPHGRGLGSGEFHCWIAAAQDGGACEVADLSARHYPRMVTDFPPRGVGQEPLTWGREPPPDYLWLDLTGREPWPVPWARLVTDPQACNRLFREMRARGQTVKALAGRATPLFEEALASGVRSQSLRG